MKWAEDWLSLYAVTDRSYLRGRTLRQVVEAALRGGATCVQLREKELAPEEFLREAIDLKALCSRYNAPLIINDNVEIALASRADGVHIGQQDEPAAEVRRRLGDNMLLGVSAQTVEQAVKAEQDGADYLGVGALFPTDTKRDAAEVSYAALKNICAAVSLPVVAIGGIGVDNIASLAGSGIVGAAAVSALFSPPDVEGATKRLRIKIRSVLGV